MIEINLVPDVKQELIRAKQVRSYVISIAIIAMIATAGVVVVLSLYVFGGQALRNKLAEDATKDEFAQLTAREDLSNLLTIQNQFSKLSQTHDTKYITSRMFDVLSIAVPDDKGITINQVGLNTEEGTMTVQAQSADGFPAYEVLKKTVEGTTLEYIEEGSTETITEPLVSEITEGEQSFGEDAEGRRVLRFSIILTYNENLLSRNADRIRIIGPDRTNATDSFEAVPESLFAPRADDVEGDN